MTMNARFPGTCGRCGRAIAVGQIIDWERGRTATHATPGDCQRAQAVPAAVAPVTIGFGSVVAFLRAARDRGLRFPKVAFLAPGGGELRLVLAGDASRNPGAVYVKVDGEYRGLVAPDGTVRGSREAGAGSLSLNGELQQTLVAVAADPATAARAYGRLMGRCSFCGLKLTDEGSTEVGYGPICARHYGLPHEPKGTPRLGLVPVEGQSLAGVA